MPKNKSKRYHHKRKKQKNDWNNCAVFTKMIKPTNTIPSDMGSRPQTIVSSKKKRKKSKYPRSTTAPNKSNLIFGKPIEFTFETQSSTRPKTSNQRELSHVKPFQKKKKAKSILKPNSASNSGLNLVKKKFSQNKINVCVRIRPFLKSEVGENQMPWTCSGKIMFQDPTTVSKMLELNERPTKSLGSKGGLKSAIIQTTTQLVWSNPYKFSAIYEPKQTTEDIFQDIQKPVLDLIFQGGNSCLAAYGSSGSGKTFTLFNNRTGLLSRFITQIFDRIDEELDKKFLIRISLLELYMENFIDLLNNPESPRNNSKNLETKPKKKIGLFIDKDHENRILLNGVTETPITNVEEAMKLIQVGLGTRQMKPTALNERSSRSHAIFKCIIESTNVKNSSSTWGELYIVDLAGSESSDASRGHLERMREGFAINKSLLTLKDVISKLSAVKPKKTRVPGTKKNQRYSNIPFRRSKLTQLLRPALGFGALTFIIATLSPTIKSCMQSHRTLKFAHQCTMVENIKKLNKKIEPKTCLLEQYSREIQRLKAELLLKNSQLESSKQIGDERMFDSSGENFQTKFDLIQAEKSNLQKQLEQLKKFILNPGKKKNVMAVPGSYSSPSLPQILQNDSTCSSSPSSSSIRSSLIPSNSVPHLSSIESSIPENFFHLATRYFHNQTWKNESESQVREALENLVLAVINAPDKCKKMAMNLKLHTNLVIPTQLSIRQSEESPFLAPSIFPSSSVTSISSFLKNPSTSSISNIIPELEEKMNHGIENSRIHPPSKLISNVDPNPQENSQNTFLSAESDTTSEFQTENESENENESDNGDSIENGDSIDNDDSIENGESIENEKKIDAGIQSESENYIKDNQTLLSPHVHFSNNVQVESKFLNLNKQTEY